MTIESTTNKVLYSGTGGQVAFPYSFRIFDASDMVVILLDAEGVETPLTLNTDFSVSGVGDIGGGTVTLIGDYAVSGSKGAPPIGAKILLKRMLQLKQEADYTEGGAFLAESHEAALDRLVCISQQIQEQLDRSIKVTETNTENPMSAEDILDAVGDLETATAAALQAAESAASAKADAEQTAADRIACDANSAATDLAKGIAVAAASAAQGYATSAEANSAAPAWSPATSYSFPDITAYTDGNTYRCTGTDIVGEAPDTSANWVRLTTRMTDFFDLDDGGDLMPAVTPGYSVEFELDVNGDVQPR